MHSEVLDRETTNTGDAASAASDIRLEEVLHGRGGFLTHVDRACELLRAYPEMISNARQHFNVLDPLIEHMESRIFHASNADTLLFELKRNPQQLSLINDAYCAWETALEQIFVTRFCEGNGVSMYDYRLNNRFQRLLMRETSMLRGAPKRALFIGSGPFPITALWLNRILGIPVDGLDVSLDAVTRSRELVDTLGLGGSIGIIHNETGTYDVSAYDVIVVALLAKPKDRILENIHRTAKADCEVICRTSFGLRSAVYEPTLMSSDMLTKFSIEDTRIVSGTADDTISSLKLKAVR